MQNVKTIIITVIIGLLIGAGITYALTDTPEVRIEKENKQAIRECLSGIDYESTSNQILRATETCSKLEMKRIIGKNILNATGGIAPVPSKIKVSPDSETMDEFLIRIDMNLDKLHNMVCKKQINSPLCKDKSLFGRLYQITEERLPGKNFYPILLGITNAESSIGLNFAKDNIGGTCVGRNNWGGIKWKKTDDGKSVKDQSIPDQYGCYLYKFDSIEDYWISKVNTVRFGYKGCVDSPTPILCMSYAYVGDRNVAEESWIKNVSIFLD